MLLTKQILPKTRDYQKESVVYISLSHGEVDNVDILEKALCLDILCASSRCGSVVRCGQGVQHSRPRVLPPGPAVMLSVINSLL